MADKERQKDLRGEHADVQLQLPGVEWRPQALQAPYRSSEPDDTGSLPEKKKPHITLTRDQVEDVGVIAGERLKGGAIGGGFNRDKKSVEGRNFEGVLGEYAMALYLEVPIDRVIRPEGDKGVDLEVPVQVEDLIQVLAMGVRYTRFPRGRLYQDRKYPKADVLGLAVEGYGDRVDAPFGPKICLGVRLAGWVWNDVFMKECRPDHKHNHPGWYVMQNRLRKMEDLWERRVR